MGGLEFAVLLVAWVLAGISPGPATLAIAGTSMAQGRAQGVALALGVFTGSAFWGLAAGFGLGALMLANVWAVEVLRYVSATYLIWLGYKSLKAAYSHNRTKVEVESGKVPSIHAAYLKGLLIHVTNPKAILAWGAVFSVAVPPGAPLAQLVSVGLTLGLCSFLLFPAYAWVFSTEKAMQTYRRFGRWISGVFGLMFGAAGFSILTGQLR